MIRLRAWASTNGWTLSMTVLTFVSNIYLITFSLFKVSNQVEYHAYYGNKQSSKEMRIESVGIINRF